MKKIYFLLSLLIIILSCSKDDSATEQQQSKCSQINTFNASQQVDVLNYSITASGSPAAYEFVFLDSQYNTDPNHGNVISVPNASGNISLDNNVTQNRTYYIYARVICANGEKSDWSAPKIIYINNYCGKPYNLIYSGQLTWDDSNFGSGTVSYYQVQYGAQGFSLGSGTTINANNEYLSNIPMAAQTTYDFYVRSYCNDGKGWSSWTGPYAYFSQYTQNMCSVPTNLAYTLESQTSSYAWIALNWNYNGESNFEYTIVSQGASVSSGTVYSASTGGWPVHQLTKGYNYHFYVRAVCANGNKTSWSTAKLIDL
ncbi:MULTISPECIES: hypothetical protein [Flavobacterium]|uniref:Fibronectin type-III domain-containing protein n=1 Tax=Flavobacterium hankyongi TaxID=1176532 RepID=A0ABP8ZPJ6_9FLAO|nr:hypothetical protein [Flavobacterium sp. N1846]